MVVKTTRVSENFKTLRQEERKAKQIKVDQYLESIQANSFSLRKEMTRKSNLIL